jgi:hypothetical protein
LFFSFLLPYSRYTAIAVAEYQERRIRK